MVIQEHIPLNTYTTLKLGGPAAFFVSVQNQDALREAITWCKKHDQTFFVLGEGSNVLFSDAGFQGLVIKIATKGIEYCEQKDAIEVTATAGENWDDFVKEVCKRNLWGLENLSGIPGTVGAAPIQNIGAYGVEVGSSIKWVEVLNTQTGIVEIFLNERCQFSYRHSVFKQNKYLIVTRVCFILTKNARPVLHYKDVKNYFEGQPTPGIQAIRASILSIRREKFPNMNVYGTAGSFFKNPIISAEEARELKEQYPGIPLYDEPQGDIKVSLAWILDNILNLKGVWQGGVGAFEKQPLVLVTKENASANDVLHFTKFVEKEVYTKTKIKIFPEVQLVT